jgi:hypothetical protein
MPSPRLATRDEDSVFPIRHFYQRWGAAIAIEQPVTYDLLDELPPAALAAVRRVAEELTVRESMIFLSGSARAAS